MVLFFRASSFFNGNKEYFGDCMDDDGQPFFPLTYDREKWKAAIDALTEAITAAEANGMGLYNYDKEPFLYERTAFTANKKNLNTLYALRLLYCDHWNQELVWCNSNFIYYDKGHMTHYTHIT